MRKWLLRLIYIPIITFIVYCTVIIFLWSILHFSLPTSETLVHWYLGEVTQGTTAELDTPNLRCSPLYLERDRERYRGAEVRDVHVEETPGTGSSQTIRFLDVTFEYRLATTDDWQRGQIIWLSTDFKPLQPRQLMCMG